MRRLFMPILVIVVVLSAAACQSVGLPVPGSGDSANDAASASQFVPASIPGYVSTDGFSSLADALNRVGVQATVLTGNVQFAPIVAQLDDLITCYQSVGAVAARVYSENPLPLDRVPKVGLLAVINTTRVSRNLLQCALRQTFGAQSATTATIQPCGGSGNLTVNNENLEYVYAATTPELCTTFQAQFNR
ncbi:MAG: hypothetical protein J0M33_06875 [Anaerolineae bacterium]|nr:hypothetical protein [Anaerolineae bacterium]